MISLTTIQYFKAMFAKFLTRRSHAFIRGVVTFSNKKFVEKKSILDRMIAIRL